MWISEIFYHFEFLTKMKLHVADIKFSQDSISDSFGFDQSFEDLCRDIMQGEETVYSLPRIKVVNVGGEWYAIDGNRRLFVFKILYRKGKLGSGEIPVEQGYLGKAITAVEGEELEVRGSPNMEEELEEFIDNFW